MPLDRLWAGWRAEYVTAAGDAVGSSGGQGDDCVLCRVVAEDSNVVWRSALVAVVLNAYPYTSGHVMVLPARHVADLEELSGEESAGLWAATGHAVQALRAAYRPHGLNLGANLGAAAGAGVPGHLHLHVLPRWEGDTNFMTSVAETRVMPESLEASLDRLRTAWPA